MKPKTILLQQLTSDPNMYRVEQLVNRITPQAGSMLDEAEVKHLISQRELKVTIKRAQS
jgi:hypothetical protein